MSDEKKIRAGLYIGRGPKPENVDTDMYVDMEGKNVGVYIGGGQSRTLGEILEEALRDNPNHASELRNFIKEAEATPREQMKPLLKRIVDWGNSNSATIVGAAQVLVTVAKTILEK